MTERPASTYRIQVRPSFDLEATRGILDYLDALGMDQVAAHERALTQRALSGLAGIDGVRVIGPALSPERTGAVSFDLAGRHPHDVGQVLDSLGIEVRVGHHCAWPLHRKLGIVATTRASFYLYNTRGECDVFADTLNEIFRERCYL